MARVQNKAYDAGMSNGEGTMNSDSTFVVMHSTPDALPANVGQEGNVTNGGKRGIPAVPKA